MNIADEKTGFPPRARKLLDLALALPKASNIDDFIGIIQLVNTARPVDSYTTGEIDLLVHLGRLVAAAVFHHDERQRRATKFDLLVEEGIVSPEELTAAIRTAREHQDDPIKGDPVNVLMDGFGVPPDAMKASLARYYLTDFLSFDKKRIISPALLKGVNADYLRRHFVVPIELTDNTLTILLADPFDAPLIREVKQIYGAEHCRFFVGFRKEILRYIDQALGVVEEAPLEDKPDPVKAAAAEAAAIEEQAAAAQEDESILDEKAPYVVQVVNKLILDAYQRNASDIHVEPGLARQETIVRFRKDGACFTHTRIPPGLSKAVINRLKVMAGMKLEEHRFPQSGKIRLKYGDKAIELRVEVTPTVGKKEDVVMRILAGSSFLNIGELGLSEANHATLLEMAGKPYGIVLVVGPTGSGKTTTLHALLHHLNAPEKKIWTVEDPVEITQPGLRQVQVDLAIKPEPFDFARAMRSFLRADPDIIMVGEMRDKETAAIAVEASLTGHLVLSTLHTNSAPETVTRLIEMGIDPLNIADSLLGILAQRLVRVLCTACKKEYAPDKAEIEKLTAACGKPYAAACGLDGAVGRLFAPVGCARCSHTGFSGRAGIYELLAATPAVKKAIIAGQTMTAIRDLAMAGGMRTLKMDGIRRVVAGQTTLSEVLKVCID